MRIQENPLAMARPPLVPKAFQPPRENFKAPSPLATSQCQELAVSDAQSCKNSASQAHFLDGFNVDDCFDVRSIPDPPSPEPRLRRRLSSPHLPRSLEDVTNQGSVAKSNKRVRRSLCHIPSPLEQRPLEQRDEAAVSRREDFASTPDDFEPISIDMDDSQHVSRGKRRKKRQSMAIPKDLVQEHVCAMASEEPAKPASLPSPKKAFAFAGSLQNMRDLQALVRGYCDLPVGQRNSSKYVTGIQESTGYPLVNPMANKEDNPLINSNRRTILQKLSPAIDAMDRRKTTETAYWQAETICRVEKSRSGGKYRYYSLDTNTKVGSHEYKLRYMASIERGAAARLEHSRRWKAELVDIEPSYSDPICNEESFGDVGMDDCMSSDFAATQELDLDLESILAMDGPEEGNDVKTESVDEGDTMEICDVSVSLDMGEQSFMSLPFSPDEAEDREVQPEEVSLRTVSEEELPEKQDPADTPFAPTPEESSTCVSPQPREELDEPMLPFPERDETSSDPEIAAAEQKLWDRIDVVLRDYSRDVVAIMEKKRQSKDTNQKTDS
jgi:hypothetical protein